MTRRTAIPALMLVFGGALSACAETDTATRAPVYGSAEHHALGEDLHAFFVTMERASGPEQVEDYADCVVAGYALEKDYGFARKVRVYVKEEGGVWSADAVYSITPALPRGATKIDAGVAAADCAERGIPTV